MCYNYLLAEDSESSAYYFGGNTMSKELTQARLHELFNYDKHTGLLTRTKTLSPNAQIGDVVGHTAKNGYLTVRIDNKAYYVHRVILMYVNGSFPSKQTDHINHNRADNRLSNLRQVDRVENHRNRPMQRNNNSGHVGVFLYRGNRWLARIKVKGKEINLGSFIDKVDAISARKHAERLYGFHKNHGKAKA